MYKIIKLLKFSLEEDYYEFNNHIYFAEEILSKSHLITKTSNFELVIHKHNFPQKMFIFANLSMKLWLVPIALIDSNRFTWSRKNKILKLHLHIQPYLKMLRNMTTLSIVDIQTLQLITFLIPFQLQLFSI